MHKGVQDIIKKDKIVEIPLPTPLRKNRRGYIMLNHYNVKPALRQLVTSGQEAFFIDFLCAGVEFPFRSAREQSYGRLFTFIRVCCFVEVTGIWRGVSRVVGLLILLK